MSVGLFVCARSNCCNMLHVLITVERVKNKCSSVLCMSSRQSAWDLYVGPIHLQLHGWCQAKNKMESDFSRVHCNLFCCVGSAHSSTCNNCSLI